MGAMSMDEWSDYWSKDDALFRSETGAPGAAPTELIMAYLGDYDATPGTLDNELWRRTSWWIEWPAFVNEHAREPHDLEEYVVWSQNRQAEALRIAVDAEKRRFPAVGGVIIWMGHDSFPCASNTSIVDFWGRPKPAALALSKVWKSSPGGR
jgi:beta-mannosidase